MAAKYRKECCLQAEGMNRLGRQPSEKVCSEMKQERAIWLNQGGLQEKREKALRRRCDPAENKGFRIDF